MKKCLVLCMIMVLLVGCGLTGSHNTNNNPQEIVIPTIEPSQMEDIASMVPDNEEGTLYFTCKNVNEDIYLQHTERPYYEFYIISLEPLDRRQIKVKVPIQTRYATVVKEISSEDLRKTEYLLNQEQAAGTQITSNIVYPYYLYQCYRGTDWKLMSELSQRAYGAEKKLMDLILGSTEEPEFLEAKKEVGAYEAYRDLYLSDYEALTPEDIPEFYVYNVTIWFGYQRAYGTVDVVKLESEPLYTESFQTIDIQIGEKTYTENIGEIRLIAEKISYKIIDFDINDLYWEKNIFGKANEIGAEYPWGDGSSYISFFQARTKQDMTLTGLSLYNSDVTLLGTSIILRDELRYSNDGKVLNLDGEVINWDGKSPIEIKEGTSVYMYLMIYDPDQTWLNYGKRIYPILEYTTKSLVTGEDKTYSHGKEIFLDRDYSLESIWVRYATVFEDLGYSLRDYFNYYYKWNFDDRIFQDWKNTLQKYFDSIYEQQKEFTQK